MTTLKTIAERANVSTATVSRIMNGKGEASPETIKKVQEIARELNYQSGRSSAAVPQKPDTGSADLIAVMVPHLTNPFFSELLSDLEEEAAQNGVRLQICITNDDRAKIEQFVDNIINNHVFGAVVSSLEITSDDLALLENAGVHTITIDRSSFEHPYSAVDIDNKNGTYMAVRLLMESGSRRIVFLSGPESDRISRYREEGYGLAVASMSGIEGILLRGNFTLESGYRLTSDHLKSGRSVDGICASNDLMAIGAMRACREAGLSIPQDIRIIGNDDISVDAFLTPSLTSLSQKNKAVARAVISELLSLKNRESIPKKIIIQPEIIRRESL